ncbi:MAG: zinc dependent phospholipase C family protein [Candidatus Faecousia sp.]|nr:zinc dependent phospholipase C family protein [Candidatus Faecousia sp.]
MRGKSHLRIARYLLDKYLPDIPKPCQTAFRIGCIEPDRNPATYLKGSIRCQWLRGHNYKNARRFMRSISSRLERKQRLNLYDYYTLGKLIHYTTDAFTYAHNDTFPVQLREHKAYEDALQEHFLEYMEQDPQTDIPTARTIMEAISSYHKEYERTESNIDTDSRFALNACCCVLAILLLKPVF